VATRELQNRSTLTHTYAHMAHASVYRVYNNNNNNNNNHYCIGVLMKSENDIIVYSCRNTVSRIRPMPAGQYSHMRLVTGSYFVFFKIDPNCPLKSRAGQKRIVLIGPDCRTDNKYYGGRK